MTFRIGIDIGGTFTDVALVHEGTGAIEVVKVATTPDDFGRAVLDGIRSGLEKASIDPSDVTMLAHATTVVTNAILEGKGARTGIICTRGFRDLLELRRSSKASLYDLFQDGPDILVPRVWRYEITERIDAQGDVVTPLAEDEIDGLIEKIKAAELEAVSVSLVFSFLNDTHERILGERLRKALPGVAIFLSCEVLPEIREFERASTTTVCAYVAPLLESYLARLKGATAQQDLPALLVMGSSGGILTIEECLRVPAVVVESGPAAGVTAAALVGRQLGIEDLISFDMGGTTAKASLIAKGEVTITADYEVGGAASAKRWLHGTGHPIRVPVIDLAEVSAGGGSIAWIDPGGAMRIGPQSAGAVPGPAAYGRGGTLPTVTDANVVLGYLDPSCLLAGDLAVDRVAAEKAIDEHLARPLGLTTLEAASRIIEVVNANMCGALRIVTVERGLDARDFAMVAFGGAGPLHAVALADELSIPKVLIPPAPGAFSALGLVAADIKRDYCRTLFAELGSVDPKRVANVVESMEQDGRETLKEANITGEAGEMLRFADVRYPRQAYELTVPMRSGTITRETLDVLAADFHRLHEKTYGHSNPKEVVQMVNLRVTAVGRNKSLKMRQKTRSGQAQTRAREMWFPSTGKTKAALYYRDDLKTGETVSGPCVIDSLDCTIVIPPAWRGKIDDQGFIHAEKVQ